MIQNHDKTRVSHQFSIMHRLQNFYPCTSVCLVPAHKHTLKTSKLKLEIKSQTFGAFNGTFIQSEAWESHIPPASNPPQNVVRHSRRSRLLHTPLETCLPQAAPLPAPGAGTAAGALPAFAPLPPGAVGLDPLPQPDGSCSRAASRRAAEEGQGGEDASPVRGKVSGSPGTVPHRRKLTVPVPHLSVGNIAPSFLPLHPTLGNLTETVHVGTMCK